MRERAEMMGGTLEVESRPGGGTTVRLAWRSSVIRVLICDDQEMVCEGLRVILSSAPGIEVVGVAYDGAQALDLVSQTQPDLVLMDLKMPGMNGIQATRLLARAISGGECLGTHHVRRRRVGL